VTADLLSRARAGNPEAFGQLIEPYRYHLQLHCYRILGSVADAEDAVQETLLSAWESTEESVTSALKRARATLRRQLSGAGEREQPPTPGCAAERELVERFTRAFEAKDVHAIVGLLTEDVWLSMPPIPLEWQGRDLAGRFLTATAIGPIGRRLIATRANGQPAFGIYVRDPRAPVLHATGLLVLTLAGDRICAMTRFDTSMLAYFGLPRILPD